MKEIVLLPVKEDTKEVSGERLPLSVPPLIEEEAQGDRVGPSVEDGVTLKEKDEITVGVIGVEREGKIGVRVAI